MGLAGDEADGRAVLGANVAGVCLHHLACADVPQTDVTEQHNNNHQM